MGLPPIIMDLLDPGSYPEHPGKIELRQTHISYLLFTPEFVYKIKKPVDFGFLDFTTLDKRLFYCEEEVRLNRRLAPDIYIGVVPVVTREGRALMQAEGKPIEYAVKMKRIEADKVLERMLEKDKATPEIIGRIANVIAGFHMNAATGKHISAFGSPEVISRNTEENFSQTKYFVGDTISKRLFERIRSYTDNFLNDNPLLFMKRIKEGYIRDCHGDIHSEHIAVNDRIEIIDCIEFNERFRYSDVVADFAFLSMDLDSRNRADLSRVLDEEYFVETGDSDGKRLLDFYKCYRAYVRGKVEGFKSREPEVSEDERLDAIISARSHFRLAGTYADGRPSPLIVVIRGLSGTGKSTLADALASKTGFVRLSSDAIRKELAGVPHDEHRFEEFKKGIYSDDFTEKTYGELVQRASEYLRQGRSVIVDATFSKRKFLEDAKAAALEAGLKEDCFHVVECAADDETVRKRLAKRCDETVDGRAVSDAVWDIYIKQKEVYEDAELSCVKIGPAKPLSENLLVITREIFG